jgi:hypothetical protein
MANWLDKYEQGGMVLKQKTKDNYGKKPNPNDVKVSTGPNYVGSGYDVQGRDYSPAWGGMFKDGGEIPTAQNGKKKKPIYVDSKDDARYKAYQDSLKLYNITKDIQNPKYYLYPNSPVFGNSYKGTSKDFDKFIKTHKIQRSTSEKPSWKGKIKPVGNASFTEGSVYPIYKKPKQQVIVEEPAIVEAPIETSIIEAAPVISLTDEEINNEGGKYDVSSTPPAKRNLTGYRYNLTEGGTHTGGYILPNDIGELNYRMKMRDFYNKGDYRDWLGEKNQMKIYPEYDGKVDKRWEAELPKQQMGGFVYPVNYVPQAQGGMSMPGAVGFSYARTNDPAPSNGPYAKKTKASAQEGKTLPSVRSLINDTMNRKIQSKGKGKDVNTVKKDNTKTSTLKEIKKLSGKQQNELAQRLSEEQAAKDYVQANMEEAYKSPLMSPGLFTPEGAAIGALDSAVKVGPNLYEGDYGSAAVNALGALPAVAAFGPELRNIKTSIAPELRQGLHEQGLFDFFKRKPKSNYPKYRIVTDDDLSISNFNKATKDYSKVIDENNIYKDLAKSESARHQNLMKDIEEYGERWKYSDEDIVNSAKKVQDAKKEWDKYAISQEAGIKTNPKFFDDTADNLVFYAGKEGLGKEDLYKFVKGPSGDAWHTASAKPSPYTVYHTNVNDFAKLPNIRTEQEAIRAAQTEAGEVFNEKMSPYKVNLSDIPLNKYGGVIKDDLGQWAHPGEITEINSNDITMEGVPYDVLGISDTGDTKLMKPGKKYKYKGNKVTEFPMAKNGLRQEQKGLVNLDQLTNFTNYNTKQPGGWLDQY